MRDLLVTKIEEFHRGAAVADRLLRDYAGLIYFFQEELLDLDRTLKLERNIHLDRNSSWLNFEVFSTNQENWNCLNWLFETLDTWGVPLDKWECTDNPREFMRRFTNWVFIEGRIEIRVVITIGLREGNTGGCRKVYVGKKVATYETDEYKLVCDE